MLPVLLTFVLTSLFYGALFCLAAYRVARHLRENPQGAEAVVEHVLSPIMGKPTECKDDGSLSPLPEVAPVSPPRPKGPLPGLPVKVPGGPMDRAGDAPE